MCLSLSFPNKELTELVARCLPLEDRGREWESNFPREESEVQVFQKKTVLPPRVASGSAAIPSDF